MKRSGKEFVLQRKLVNYQQWHHSGPSAPLSYILQPTPRSNSSGDHLRCVTGEEWAKEREYLHYFLLLWERYWPRLSWPLIVPVASLRPADFSNTGLSADCMLSFLGPKNLLRTFLLKGQKQRHNESNYACMRALCPCQSFEFNDSLKCRIHGQHQILRLYCSHSLIVGSLCLQVALY